MVSSSPYIYMRIFPLYFHSKYHFIIIFLFCVAKNEDRKKPQNYFAFFADVSVGISLCVRPFSYFSMYGANYEVQSINMLKSRYDSHGNNFLKKIKKRKM